MWLRPAIQETLHVQVANGRTQGMNLVNGPHDNFYSQFQRSDEVSSTPPLLTNISITDYDIIFGVTPKWEIRLDYTSSM